VFPIHQVKTDPRKQQERRFFGRPLVGLELAEWSANREQHDTWALATRICNTGDVSLRVELKGEL